MTEQTSFSWLGVIRQLNWHVALLTLITFGVVSQFVSFLFVFAKQLLVYKDDLRNV